VDLQEAFGSAPKVSEWLRQLVYDTDARSGRSGYCSCRPLPSAPAVSNPVLAMERMNRLHQQ
jgi:hypothetical protein